MPTPTSKHSAKTPAPGPDAEPPLGDSDDSQKFALWKTSAPTDSSLTRFRYAVAPESWYEVTLTVIGLYGVFVGLPAVGAIWAGIVLWHRMHS